MVRRGIETQTFAPRSGDRGVHVVDAESARFGEFDDVQLAGLVDGEWPDRPRRNIFYSRRRSSGISAGRPMPIAWTACAAAFTDLLRLPSETLASRRSRSSTTSIVGPSMLVDEIRRA